ncbi:MULTISPECIES: hypothetical protein [unclassified Mesorhizobium]|uniref:hypothetical protein n=1 Tax=unclassified Mesorhizobium TaxID=325217 RepID=UPI00333D418C
MTVIAHSIASDPHGTWRVVFLPEELHLYVEFNRPGAGTNPVDWMSLDDFLARRPKDALHQRARDRLVSLICKALGACPG